CRHHRQGGGRHREAQTDREGLPPKKNQVHAEHDQRSERQRRLRQNSAGQAGIIRRHCPPPFSTASKNGDCSAGVIQLRSKSGFNPITTVAPSKRTAPSFSASVMGGNEVEDGGAVPSPPRPKNASCITRTVNAAATSTPSAATAAQAGEVCQTPIKIVSSAGNPLNPGMPMEASPAKTKVPAANGSSRYSGRAWSSSRRRVCIRS